jgi:hypothetical protein
VAARVSTGGPREIFNALPRLVAENRSTHPLARP